MVDTDDTQRMIDDGRWTTPGVWHKLPTVELKNLFIAELKKGSARSFTFGGRQLGPFTAKNVAK